MTNTETRKFYNVFDLVKITLIYTGISLCDVLLIIFQVFVPIKKIKLWDMDKNKNNICESERRSISFIVK